MKWFYLALSCVVLHFGDSKVFASSSDENHWREQRKFFQENGFLWIQHFYSPEQVLLLRSWAEDIDAAAQNLLEISRNTGFSLQSLAQRIPGALIVVPEAKDPSKVCRAEDLLFCYPDLHQFVFGTLNTYIGALTQEPYTLFKDKINFKWPGGGAFPPHQDFPAFEYFGPREHITAMVCIDAATIENGCLYVAQNWQGSFVGDPEVDQELLEKGHAVLPYVVGGAKHGSIQPKFCDKISWIPIIADPGDVVFFDSFLPHYSEPNRSPSARRAMFFTHNKLKEGEHREAYYHAKRTDPDNPAFHFATPTNARTK